MAAFSDDFDRADSATVGNGWTEERPSAWQILSNRARFTSDGSTPWHDNYLYQDAGAAFADGYAHVDFQFVDTIQSAQNAYVLVRMQGTGLDTSYLAYQTSASLVIGKRTPGFAVIDSVSHTPAQGTNYRLRLAVAGTALKATLWDLDAGTVVAEVEATDSDVSGSGRPGISGHTAGTLDYDNFASVPATIEGATAALGYDILTPGSIARTCKYALVGEITRSSIQQGMTYHIASFVDGFDRADSGTVGNGWTEERDSAWEILNNVCRFTTDGSTGWSDNQLYRPPAETFGDGTVGVDFTYVTAVGAQNPMIHARMAGTEGTDDLYLCYQTSGNLVIAKRVSVTFTPIQSVAFAPAADTPYRMTFSLLGSTLVGRVRNLSSGALEVENAVTDGDITAAGQVALSGHVSGGSVDFDDFRVLPAAVFGQELGLSYAVRVPGGTLTDFGYTATPTLAQGAEDTIRFEPLTAPASGLLDSVSVYVFGVSIVAKLMKAALFAHDAADDVGALLAETEERSIGTDDGGTWQTFAATTVLNVVEGQSYFGAAWGEQTNGNLLVGRESGQAGQEVGLLDRTYGDWPNPPSGEATDSNDYAIYATFAASRVGEALTYIVDNAIAAALDLAYTIVAPGAITRSLHYVIEGGSIGLVSDLEYRVVTTATPTRGLAYAVRTAPPVTRGLTYVVAAAAAPVSRQLRYTIQGEALTLLARFDGTLAGWALDQTGGTVSIQTRDEDEKLVLDDTSGSGAVSATRTYGEPPTAYLVAADLYVQAGVTGRMEVLDAADNPLCWVEADGGTAQATFQTDTVGGTAFGFDAAFYRMVVFKVDPVGGTVTCWRTTDTGAPGGSGSEWTEVAAKAYSGTGAAKIRFRTLAAGLGEFRVDEVKIFRPDIFCIGDSLTAGIGDTGDGAWNPNPQFWRRRNTQEDETHAYPDALGKLFTPNVWAANRGVSGDTVADVAARLQGDVLDPGAQRVVVMAGTNDIGGGATAGDIEADYQGILSLLSGAGVEAILCTIPPADSWDAAHNAVKDAVNDWLRASATGTQFRVAEVHDRIKDPANPDQRLPAYASTGNVHLSKAGYEAVAQTVFDKLSAWSVNRAMAYRVRGAPVTKGLEYRVRTAPTSAPALTYEVQSAQAVTRALQYTVQVGGPGTKALDYAVRTSPVTYQSLTYHVRTDLYHADLTYVPAGERAPVRVYGIGFPATPTVRVNGKAQTVAEGPQNATWIPVHDAAVMAGVAPAGSYMEYVTIWTDNVAAGDTTLTVDGMTGQIAFTVGSQGVVRFVNNTVGNDGNAGTEAAPWATPEAFYGAPAGSVLVFRGTGTDYTDPITSVNGDPIVGVNDGWQGAPGMPIAFTTYPAEAVTISNSGASQYPVAFNQGGDYMTASMFEIVGSGILIWGGQGGEHFGIRLSSLRPHDSGNGNGGISNLRQVNDSVFFGLELFNTGVAGENNAHGLYFGGWGETRRNVLEWCNVHDHQGGSGLQIFAHGVGNEICEDFFINYCRFNECRGTAGGGPGRGECMTITGSDGANVDWNKGVTLLFNTVDGADRNGIRNITPGGQLHAYGNVCVNGADFYVGDSQVTDPGCTAGSYVIGTCADEAVNVDAITAASGNLALIDNTTDYPVCVGTSSPKRTRALAYRVTFTPAAVGRSLAYAVTATPAAQTAALRYTIRGQAGVGRSLAYAIAETPGVQLGLGYAVAGETFTGAVEAAAAYAVQTPGAVARAMAYAVVSRSAEALETRYAVRTAPAIAEALGYAARTTPAAIARSLAYAATARQAIPRALQYSIAGFTEGQIGRELAYRIGQIGARPLPARYVILGEIPPEPAGDRTILIRTPRRRIRLMNNLERQVILLGRGNEIVFALAKNNAIQDPGKYTRILAVLHYRTGGTQTVDSALDPDAFSWGGGAPDVAFKFGGLGLGLSVGAAEIEVITFDAEYPNGESWGRIPATVRP